MRINPLPLLMLAPTLALAEPRAFSGQAELEVRHFTSDALNAGQRSTYPSLAVSPEYYREWNDGDDAFTAVLFARYDPHDSERRHADLREFNWLHLEDNWQLRVGIGKVFWGSVEAQHLVDIVNQTDALEGLDGEDKLGQPMANLVFPFAQGEFSLFWLPRFRERESPGPRGRPRLPLPVDEQQTRWESPDKAQHQDYAARLSLSIGALDLALSHFYGTSREPLLEPGLNAALQPVLIPYYPLIRQTGLELTAATGDWLWKLEALRRSGFGDGTYHALAGGFEYTWVGVGGSDLDIGLLAEYHWDERDEDATSPFQDDLFLGMRLTFNDFQSSELLAGVVDDRSGRSRFWQLEGSRRIGDNLKLSVEARLLERVDSSDPLYVFRADDLLQMTLTHYF